jgi:hypothetical protein
VNREMDEIIPGYAFRKNSPISQPAIWFRKNTEDKAVYFLAENKNDPQGK